MHRRGRGFSRGPYIVNVKNWSAVIWLRCSRTDMPQIQQKGWLASGSSLDTKYTSLENIGREHSPHSNVPPIDTTA
jgi:hypothetical protein